VPPVTAPAPRRGVPEEASAIVGLFFGLGMAVLFLIGRGSDELSSRPDRVFGALALGAFALLPGILSLLGRWRPALYLAAVPLGYPVMALLFTIVAAPLVLCSALALVAYARRHRDSIPRVPAPMIAIVSLGIGVGAFLSMFVHQDPRSFSTATSSTYTSDVVTTPEALASLAISLLGIVLLWVLARPRPKTGVVR
jgi:hypothetical protein